MRGVTIDKLDMKVHERYAKDQEKLERKYITEANDIPPHSEISGTSSIYSSKWEELFELGERNLPWAAFCPPPMYAIQPRKFFSHKLIPNIYCGDEEDEGEEQEEQDDEKNQELIKQILEAQKKEGANAASFEKDRSVLLNLLESIKYFDKLLAQINSRKMQYQKG